MKCIKIDKEELEKEKEKYQWEIGKLGNSSIDKYVKLSLEQWINCIDWVLSISEEIE